MSNSRSRGSKGRSSSGRKGGDRPPRGGAGRRGDTRDARSGAGGRRDDEERPSLPTNWAAVLSLFAGTVAAAYALPFFPGAVLLSVIGGYLGERALQFARERPGRPGRALAWWALTICGIAFLFSLAVALQAQTILGDADLLRDALDRVEEAEATEAALVVDGVRV